MGPKQSMEPVHLSSDLKRLRLPSMGKHWQRLADEANRSRRSHSDYLADLAHLELTDRRERRVARRIKEAHFPALKTLDSFDFSAQPGLNQDEVLSLARCDFVERHANVILIGEVGTGKTHLASSIGLAACQQDYRVRFITTSELCNALVEAKAQDRLSRKIKQLASFDLVVLDELGYVPFDKLAADLLFGFIAKTYEKRSLIITTNLPFARWTEVFLDATAAAAVIDRIAHHATILQTEGESFRLREAKAHKARKRAEA